MQILAIDLYPNAWDTFMFMMIGFIVVIGVLAFQAMVTNLLGKPFKALDDKAAKKAAEAKKKSIAKTPSKRGNPELAGVIGSAVYAALDGTPHRIVSVTPASELTPELVAVITAATMSTMGACSIVSIKPIAPDYNWANSGRMAIFSSHRPNK